jgi:hypothetical protein
VESCHYREKYLGPSVAIFRRLRTGLKTTIEVKVRLFVFALFTPAITPSFAARWSDTAPKFGSEIKNRASISPFCGRHTSNNT